MFGIVWAIPYPKFFLGFDVLSNALFFLDILPFARGALYCLIFRLPYTIGKIIYKSRMFCIILIKSLAEVLVFNFEIV